MGGGVRTIGRAPAEVIAQARANSLKRGEHLLEQLGQRCVTIRHVRPPLGQRGENLDIVSTVFIHRATATSTRGKRGKHGASAGSTLPQ